jgi:hypothetical protein
MSTPKWKKDLRKKQHAEAKQKKEFEKKYGLSTKSRKKKEFVPLKMETPFHRETPDYPSLSNTVAGFAPRKESPKYTGTLIKGISTMHKSNAVPILSEEEARDHASMRR